MAWFAGAVPAGHYHASNGDWGLAVKVPTFIGGVILVLLLGLVLESRVTEPLVVRVRRMGPWMRGTLLAFLASLVLVSLWFAVRTMLQV